MKGKQNICDTQAQEHSFTPANAVSDVKEEESHTHTRQRHGTFIEGASHKFLQTQPLIVNKSDSERINKQTINNTPFCTSSAVSGEINFMSFLTMLYGTCISYEYQNHMQTPLAARLGLSNVLADVMFSGMCPTRMSVV